MKKFWAWMEKKGYGKMYSNGVVYLIDYANESLVHASGTMLIGYMMEYLDTREDDWHLENDWIDLLSVAVTRNSTPTKQRYNWLESKINGLEQAEDR